MKKPGKLVIIKVVKARRMRDYFYQVIVWTPRILALLIVFILSLFATESLGSNGPFLRRILELCLQLSPAAIVFGLTIFAWRNPGYGAYFFAMLGMVFFFYFDHKSIIDFIFISGPFFFIALLFLLSKIFAGKQSAANS